MTTSFVGRNIQDKNVVYCLMLNRRVSGVSNQFLFTSKEECVHNF